MHVGFCTRKREWEKDDYEKEKKKAHTGQLINGEHMG